MPGLNAVQENVDLTIVKVDQEVEGFRISWSNDEHSFFHFIWLRDGCYCETCGDTYSSKRYVVPHQFDLDDYPGEWQISSDGALTIVWESDKHRSVYRAGWLFDNRYDDAARERRFHLPILWDCSINSGLPESEFPIVQSSETALLDLYQKLLDYGFVVIRNGPAEKGGVEQVARLIGEMNESAYTQIFDLSPSSSVKTMGNTQQTVPPHTDEAFRYSPPGINILACIHPAETGGDSVLVDGFSIAGQLRSEDMQAFDLLCQYEQSFHRIHSGALDQRARQRMIALDDRDEIVGVRVHTRAAGPLCLPSDLIRPYYAAHQAFCQRMMNSDNQARFRLESGDSVLFDNHRVLHSRNHFSDPTRFLQICNVSREEFHEQYRLLATRLGLHEAANRILPSGMTV
ncbi:MAG: gamma-butyrobetaine dioxygenase [Gammaproteobacteria bacterium]|jgi:gamma-butyrobetaine dioxygenase